LQQFFGKKTQGAGVLPKKYNRAARKGRLGPEGAVAWGIAAVKA